MQASNKVLIVGTVLAALVAVPVVVVTAQDSHRSALKARIDTKKQIASAMAEIAKMSKGETEFGPDVIRAAEKVVALSPRIDRMFPQGSAVGDSRAKAEIWSQWEDFRKKAASLESAVTLLIPTVKSGEKEKIRDALVEVGKTCTSCHDQYREPKN